MSFRPMPILTLCSVVSLVILVLLGNWQYARYTEKISNPSVQEQADAREFIEITLDTSRSGYVQQVYGFADSEPIWRRYAPGVVSETGEPVLVMVDATGGAEPVPKALSELSPSLRFEGVLSAKTASNSAFAAQDDPDANIWYALKPADLASKYGFSDTLRIAEPVIMTVRNAADLTQTRQTYNPYAFAKPVDPLPPERHFGYALTWWGMALGLVGVYLGLHYSSGRLQFKKA